ncbi:MAG TPA: hypothetical protein VMG12_11690 [Polyangiaceae bacterium]|nr:hypothetical protein [Polyangiaceae bacterium]
MSVFELRRLGRSLGAGLALVGASCERSSDVAPPSPAPVESSAARGLATATAFDLVPAPEGAVLAWALAGSSTLRLARYDTDGNPTSGAVARVPGVGPGVADLALAASESDVALAWSEPASSEGKLRAAWVAGDNASRTFELGPGFHAGGAARGGLALVARDRGALLLARGLAAGCADERERECSAFQFFELGPDAARATGLSLTVPSPCASHSAQLVSARRSATGIAGPFEYGICAGPPGASGLTVFSIQPNPAYAAAEEALAGCTPLGAARFGGEATFVGVCAGQRRAVSVPLDGGPLVARDLDQRGLICNASGALLRFGSGWLRPNEPLGNLELLLNDDLAPPGARAVWAGAALLVAQTRGEQLSLSRFACRQSRLVQLDAARDAGD